MSGGMTASHSGTIRTALVGGGRIGELHARNLVARQERLELSVIVEPSPSEALKEFAKCRGVEIVPRIGDSFREVTAAILALPTNLHEDALVQAAAAGVHVLCEKPLAGDLDSATRMLGAAEEAGILVQVGFNRRFDHNFRALRTAVEDGALGRVEIVRVTSRDPAPPGIDYVKRSGGLFMDMTIHDFDMIRYLTGDEVERVFARGTCLVDPEIGGAGDIDTAVITLRFRGGALGIIENSRRASYGYDQRAEIHGSLGAAEIRNDTKSRVTISNESGVHDEKPLHFFLQRYRDSFVAEVKSFASAISNGATPEVTGRDGLEAMRIAEACRRSALGGHEVSLEEVE